MSRMVAAIMTDIASLLLLFDTYCAATGRAEATVSTRVLSDGKRIRKLREGADIGTRRLAEAVEWFSANWPAGAEWPAAIRRPTHTSEAAE